jgi:hypothetical protein
MPDQAPIQDVVTPVVVPAMTPEVFETVASLAAVVEGHLGADHDATGVVR